LKSDSVAGQSGVKPPHSKEAPDFASRKGNHRPLVFGLAGHFAEGVY
jgi:hypothetical protein